MTVGWAGGGISNSADQVGPVLANKRAKLYQLFKNNHSGKVLPFPARADYKTVPLEDRVPWNNTLRGKYIKDYINTYGDPKWDWSALDIHHVRPRERGGQNNFANLYPIPRDIHQQIVTPWWVCLLQNKS
ncbi:HNH endonuclease signature motif containing protein, partial [Cytobacillus horneckiae]|nr:HNH endonuclease signature motif containing protein [Cytobacillus horneckiae]